MTRREWLIAGGLIVVLWHDAVTQRLNEIYRDEESSLDPVLLAMQATVLDEDRW